MEKLPIEELAEEAEALEAEMLALLEKMRADLLTSGEKNRIMINN